MSTWRVRSFLRRRRRPAYRGADVAIIGFFRSRIGIGRAAELLAVELASVGVNVRRIDVTELFGFDQNVACETCFGLAALADPGLTDIIIHMNPPQFYRVLRWLRPAHVQDRAVIGYFAWELALAPRGWLPALACVDEAWVPSAFVRDAIEARWAPAAAKILISPHRIQTELWRKPSSEQRRQARAELGLPDSAFVLLTSFAMTSSFARKNPLAAAQCFRKAFPEPDKDVVLVIRCLDHASYPHGGRQLLDELAKDARIRLVLEDAFGTSIQHFYHAADGLLSLHRGEGFGLNIAEALAMDMAVVATAWSLNDAFQSHPRFHGVGSVQAPIVDPQHMYDIVPGTSWADPDLEEAAHLLKRLRSEIAPVPVAQVTSASADGQAPASPARSVRDLD